MRVYDKNKIGKLFAAGGEHLVYAYENDKVIKFSLLYLLLGKIAYDKAKKDRMLCEKYFGNFYLPTELAISKNKKHIVHIQPKIVGMPLVKKHLLDKEVFEKFKKLVECNKRLENDEGVSVDLLGRGGVFKNSLSNIFLTEDKGLFIIDATLLSFGGVLRFIPKSFVTLLLWRQNKVIGYFLN